MKSKTSASLRSNSARPLFEPTEWKRVSGLPADCCRDENQNVNHLLYQPQNRHFGYAFDTWVQHLKISGGKTAETYRLSQNLTDELAVLLKSGYRVFNQMFPFANDILGNSTSITLKQAKRDEEA